MFHILDSNTLEMGKSWKGMITEEKWNNIAMPFLCQWSNYRTIIQWRLRLNFLLTSTVTSVHVLWSIPCIHCVVALAIYSTRSYSPNVLGGCNLPSFTLCTSFVFCDYTHYTRIHIVFACQKTWITLPFFVLSSWDLHHCN